MKAIQTPIIITSIRSRKDGSLGFTCETPEYTPNERVTLMELQGVNVKAVFTPSDEPKEETITVNTDIQNKSQSQRIRAVLFRLWQQSGQTQSFEVYYNEKTEKYIEHLKSFLE